MHTPRSLERDRRIPQPDRDVLRAEFDAATAAMRIRACAQEEIGDVLLHQHVLAGVGNEFKSEICFVCGVNPFARVSALHGEQIMQLIQCAQQLVKANVIEDDGDTVLTYRGRGRRTTHATDPRERVWVYGRAGEACRKCGTSIERRLQGSDARVTFWCPACQKIGDHLSAIREAAHVRR